MFFVVIAAAPFAAGLVAGILGAGRRVALALAAACVALGVAGAIVVGTTSDTTDRAGSIIFALVAGLAAAGLVFAGRWLAGLVRGRVRTVPL